jgi:ABC-2 type transport system ATP-binding protein
LIISSHILHEVDMMSDRVVLLNNGYVVAEGGIQGVRDEMDVEHPVQVLIRCNHPSLLASRIFQNSEVVEARVHDDAHGLFVKIRNQDQFYLSLNEVVSEGQIEVESIAPVDDDLSAVYEYLIGAQ